MSMAFMVWVEAETAIRPRTARTTSVFHSRLRPEDPAQAAQGNFSPLRFIQIFLKLRTIRCFFDFYILAMFLHDGTNFFHSLNISHTLLILFWFLIYDRSTYFVLSKLELCLLDIQCLFHWKPLHIEPKCSKISKTHARSL